MYIWRNNLKITHIMNKERLNIELSYLKKLVAGLKTLKESQFDYDQFVSEYDEENQCGTVCCPWGWMPKFVPESGVKWERSGDMNNHPVYFFKAIKYSDVGFVFLGRYVEDHYVDDHDFDKFGCDCNANLQQVINKIEHVIYSYEKKTIKL